ncbi:hypothetical protein ACPOM7_07775 [Peribacillus castrilensis]|uniref:hypothetical protein n=1 Tax=Peribacillus TaxID=2675229 RepID=UPI00209C89F3|nr:hypothetical protein [Peribacillus frigoritolerans]MCP1095891.1 hypothetical protein [Bacillaceae bacterium OS4b]MCP1154567.1 hypothetical protein [Peribacillus frigoritolerans]MCT1387480.1 hypothetical protein [Peribacillus frigoritolerans]
MKKKFGILASIFIVLTSFFLFTKPYKEKTKPVEDIFEVYPTDQVITNEMIFIEGIDEVNPGNIDLNDEEELEKLVKKQYEQNQKGEIIFTEKNQ